MEELIHKSEAEHKYLFNSQISKSLCLQMEMLSVELSYYQRVFNIIAIEEVSAKLTTIKAKLDIIWQEQIDLYCKSNTL